MIDRLGGPLPAPGPRPADLKGQGPAQVGSLPARVDKPSALPPETGHPVAADVGRLIRQMASAPPVDASRIAELKARIEGGAYPVNPSAIADAMLAAERSRG